MNKNDRSRNPLNSKPLFKWVFIDIIQSTAPKRLTSDTTFPNYLLIVDAYSIGTKRFSMENISTKEVMNNLDMFQYRFGKIDEFVWWG